MYSPKVLAVDLERRAGMLAAGDRPLADLCRDLDRLLREAVPYAAAAWGTLDPATGLTTSCIHIDIPADPGRELRTFDYEFSEDEPDSFLSMLAHGESVVILSEVTGGKLERSGRYRDILEASGVTDELRAVLRSDGRPWGQVTLFRVDGRFSASDAALVSAFAPAAAKAMQMAMLRAAAKRDCPVERAPGILRVTDGGVRAMTEPGRGWLERGGAALVTAATAAAAAARASGGSSIPARLALDDGTIVTLHAATIDEEGAAVAVIVDAARPIEVSAMLVDAYGLTARQRAVLGLLLLGRSLAEIAHELGISEHTAHDHCKAIYKRVGVTSRGELAALLQAEQYAPRWQEGAMPSPYGGFLTA